MKLSRTEIDERAKRLSGWTLDGALMADRVAREVSHSA